MKKEKEEQERKAQEEERQRKEAEQAAKNKFASKPSFGSKPSFASKPGLGSKPRMLSKPTSGASSGAYVPSGMTQNQTNDTYMPSALSNQTEKEPVKVSSITKVANEITEEKKPPEGSDDSSYADDFEDNTKEE